MTNNKKTVALVGMAPTTRDKAPWDNEDIEIWVINESAGDDKKFKFVKRKNRVFQLHPKWSYMRENNHNDPLHHEWMRRQTAVKDGGFPIYIQEEDHEVPAGVRYPLFEICNHFSINPDINEPSHFRYFTSTFPYMVALAIYEGFERIEVYGFEMGSNTEFAQQRSSALWWLGVAWGSGIEIGLPEGAGLVGWHDQMYGYQSVPEVGRMHYEIYKNQHVALVNKSQAEINHFAGQQKSILDEINSSPQMGMGKKDNLLARAQKLERERINAMLQHAAASSVVQMFDFLIAQIDGMRLPDIEGFNPEPNKHEPE